MSDIPRILPELDALKGGDSIGGVRIRSVIHKAEGGRVFVLADGRTAVYGYDPETGGGYLVRASQPGGS